LNGFALSLAGYLISLGSLDRLPWLITQRAASGHDAILLRLGILAANLGRVGVIFEPICSSHDAILALEVASLAHQLSFLGPVALHNEIRFFVVDTVLSQVSRPGFVFGVR
jgi:hypothetical protein